MVGELSLWVWYCADAGPAVVAPALSDFLTVGSERPYLEGWVLSGWVRRARRAWIPLSKSE